MVSSTGNTRGDIFKRLYTWKAEQLVQSDTCVLGEKTPRTEKFPPAGASPGYDALLRLTHATGPMATQGGAVGDKTYGYDGRGNRTAEKDEVCPWSYVYGTPGHPDWLTARNSGCAGAMLGASYQYDLDGRVSAKMGPVDSSGLPSNALEFGFGPGGGTGDGTDANDTVFKSVSVNGAVYNYYYDAFNHRRLKSYPAGTSDEYFRDLSGQLLVDQGNDTVIPPVAAHVIDEYVWLGGRPVVIVRGKMDTHWARLSDNTVDCTRNGEASACGFYFPVTDFMGKPVLMLDSSKRIAGMGDYEPFGRPNRVPVNAETAHPYQTNLESVLAEMKQPPGNASMSVDMRVLFGVVDTESNGPLANDFARLVDGETGGALGVPVGGHHVGQLWSDWVTPTSGHLKIQFNSDGASCCPTPAGGLDCSESCSGHPYSGVSVDSYEYRRYQTGASWFWTPLRFAGQYFDAESDLFENWNRYYEPSTGRYLQPEPLATSPDFLQASVLQGLQSTAYGYALNNPNFATDSTGENPLVFAPVLLPALPIGIGIGIVVGGSVLAYCAITHSCPPIPMPWDPPASSPPAPSREDVDTNVCEQRSRPAENERECKCFCMARDGRGIQHGPYPNGKTSNQATCNASCQASSYDYGFCK